MEPGPQLPWVPTALVGATGTPLPQRLPGLSPQGAVRWWDPRGGQQRWVLLLFSLK